VGRIGNAIGTLDNPGNVGGTNTAVPLGKLNIFICPGPFDTGS